MIASSMLTQFLFAAGLLTLLLALVVVAPWLRRSRANLAVESASAASGGISLMDLNVSVFRERLRELAADAALGRLAPDEYAGLKADLERQLLAAAAGQENVQRVTRPSREAMQRPPLWVVVLVAFWLPVLVFGLYFWQAERAQPQALSESAKSQNYNALWSFWAAQDQYGAVAGQLVSGQISAPPDEALQHSLALLQAMQVQAYRHPLDAAYWGVLAEGYRAAEMAAPAQAALAHAHRLAPDDVGISMRYVQMRFAAQAGKMDDTTRDVLRHVLEIQPQHEGAMMLLAVASYRDQQYDAAVIWLQRLKAARLARAAGQPVDPALLTELDDTIAKARQAMQGQSSSASTMKSSNNRVLNAHQSVSITVQLAPMLQAKIKPSDTLFVYARALTGMPAPYAVQKIPAGALLRQLSLHEPLAVTLSDDNHMLPDRTLSSAVRDGTALVVAARISRQDDPLPHAGDFESLPVPVGDMRSARVLYIDQVRP